MKDQTTEYVFPFLKGGGEMGKITREKNWEDTAMGHPDQWPSSIKPILSLLLNSKSPMFLFWGAEHICFYNDAYRPSLGKDGKHPNILGVPAKDAWPEIWSTIQPLLQNVIENRDAFWVEDQLIPIYRNGTIEEVYWNFGYTPVLGDSSKVEGVFVTCSETTEKVLAMKSLEEKGNELKRTIDAANLGTWDFDMKTSKVKINDKVIDWSGLERTYLKSAEDLLSTVDPVDKERVILAIEKVTKPSGNNDLDISFLIKDRKLGKKREVRAVGQSLFDKNGKLYRFNGTFQDVTEQQATLRNLRKKEERFRQLVDNAPIGIAIVDAESFKVNIINQKALDIWEKKIYECQDKPIFEVLPETRNGLEPILTEILQTKREQTGTEYPFTLERKGVLERGFFNFIFKPVVENGSVTEIVLVAYEVTENVRAKFGIEETETQVKNVFDQLPVAMAIVEGPNLKLEVANDTMLKKFLKVQRPKIIGKTVKEFLPQKMAENLLEQVNTCFEKRVTIKSNDVLLEVGHSTEEDMYVDVSCHPLHEIDNTVRKVIVVVDDITDRVVSRKKLEDFSKKLERQVDERTQQLEKSNHKLHDTVKRLKSTNAELESFAYIASHDLKEPLRKIQMFMERVVAFDSDNISTKSKQYIGRIDNAIDRMRTLIDELLAYSRTGSENFRFEDIDLRSTLESVIENLSGKIEESNAQIDYDQLGIVSAIPFQLKQVFQNLLENSLKFTAEDTIPKIKVTSNLVNGEDLDVSGYVTAEEYLMVSFKDNGIGFDQENQNKIFEIFQRLHGKLEYQGTGIGLAIVKKIIENHKGFIEAKSEKGKGANFILYLPVKRGADR